MEAQGLSHGIQPSVPATPVSEYTPAPDQVPSPLVIAAAEGGEVTGSASMSPLHAHSQPAQRILSPGTLLSPPLVPLENIPITEERIRNASTAELRAMVTNLLPSLQEARTDAAQYKLQYRMLAIESAEAVERIQVEMDMAQREIEVLQGNDNTEPRIVHVRAEVDPNMRQIHVEVYNSMVQEIFELKTRNNRLESTVSQQKRLVVQQEGEIATLNDRISLLRERLRENRAHLNRYRSSAGFLDSTPTRASAHMSPPSGRTREGRPFAALLHATDLMSSSGPMTPRTPKRKRGPSTSPTPMTPRTVQPRLSRDIYQTPQTSRSTRHLQVPHTAPQLRMPSLLPSLVAQAGVGMEQIRESEGTVSAADDSEAETEVPEDNDLAESQAGLAASHMLRTPTRQRQDPLATSRANLVQGRLFGHVRKLGVQRSEDAPPSKSNTTGEVIGSATDRFKLQK